MGPGTVLRYGTRPVDRRWYNDRPIYGLYEMGTSSSEGSCSVRETSARAGGRMEGIACFARCLGSFIICIPPPTSYAREDRAAGEGTS